MLGIPDSVRIFLAVDPVDMRKQFDGLWAVAREHLGEDPMQGALYVFTNKRRSLLKVLYWDGTGVCVLAKRLEKGRFSWPASLHERKTTLKPAALSMLLEGIDLKDGCSKMWYNR